MTEKRLAREWESLRICKIEPSVVFPYLRSKLVVHPGRFFSSLKTPDFYSRVATTYPYSVFFPQLATRRIRKEHTLVFHRFSKIRSGIGGTLRKVYRPEVCFAIVKRIIIFVVNKWDAAVGTIHDESMKPNKFVTRCRPTNYVLSAGMPLERTDFSNVLRVYDGSFLLPANLVVNLDVGNISINRNLLLVTVDMLPQIVPLVKKPEVPMAKALGFYAEFAFFNNTYHIRSIA